MARLKCLFKNCTCTCYKKNRSKSKICLMCNHHKIWHEKTKPPSDAYLQFCSPREKARKPIYVSDKRFVNMFVPEAIPVVDAVEIPNDCYCPCVVALPV